MGSLEAEADMHRRQTEWVNEHLAACEREILAPILQAFKQAGFRDSQLEAKCRAPLPETDVAHEILLECEERGHDTIVMGKRGRSRVRVFLTGSTTEKVVRYAKDRAVWVIE